MGAYIYVVAAAIAVIAILSVFKINIEKIKENPEQLSKVQTKFFIGVAMCEAIPLVLLIYGFVNAEPVASIEELYLPALLIILMMVFAAFFIFLQNKVGVDDDKKQIVNTFSMIGLAMTNAIPIIALVFLFMTVS